MITRIPSFFLALGLVCVAAPASAETQTAPRPVAQEYIIGVEDELRVVVWGEKDLSVGVKVRPDGKVTVPLVNDVAVVGLTTGQVREKIATALAQFLRDPSVTVLVESIQSYRVFFIGEIRRQGALNFYQPTRLLQGLASAGGKTEFTDRIIVLRTVDGEEQRQVFDYKKLVAGTQQNIVLEPGDTVVAN